MAGASAAVAIASELSHRLNAADSATPKLKGHVNHSVCKWCYEKIPLEDFCKAGKEIGLQSVELLEVKDFPTLKKYDLTCAVVSGVPGGIWPLPPDAPAMVQLFVGVPDVAAAVAQAQELGGQVIVPPQVLPDGDEMAILVDPDGVPFGVMKQH